MIVVLTAPRAVSYLEATLQDVDLSAKSEKRVVVADGCDSVVVPDGWQVVKAEKPSGHHGENKWATWKAFQLAAEAGEDLLLFEDDISLSKNAAHYIERFPVPSDVAMVSFYDWASFHTCALIRIRMHVFAFCQALKVPLRTCQELAAGWAEMNSSNTGASDEALKRFGQRRDWFFGIHSPGLVQHVGAESAVRDGRLNGTRVSQTFVKDRDCNNLPHQPYN